MPSDPPPPTKALAQVVEEVGDYPREAFEFVLRGLNYTVSKLHGQASDPQASHHVSGHQLCEGLREFALMQWGFLARTVLNRWNILGTNDFGRIVFASVENGLLSKTENDRPEDFKNVYDFRKAFELDFHIGAEP